MLELETVLESNQLELSMQAEFILTLSSFNIDNLTNRTDRYLK
jgi:hypothetical protein